ncbi:hypothetical protein BU15DRAFT_70709 [Melanogaster broomeanus]|nr:hypothetical protein BU15DRAFT_70709 [Melanogaster broomeanus]
MSFDDLNSSVNDRVRQSDRVVDVEPDVGLSGSLLTESDQTPISDSELVELLAHLDNADSMARGVESRLDGILDTLDNLLAGLEPKDGPKSQDEPVAPPADPPPDASRG